MFAGKMVKTTLAASAVLGILMLAPSLVGAYCVYNNTNVTLQVCGGNCGRCMKKEIPPGGRACCPGNDKGCRGNHVIQFQIVMGDVQCGGWDSRYSVDAHGWVDISGTCTQNFRECNNAGARACEGLTFSVYSSDGRLVYQGPGNYNGLSCL